MPPTRSALFSSLLIVALGALFSCGKEEPKLTPVKGKPGPSKKTEGEPRKYLLERVDDIAVAQLYADGFEDLSLKDKMLCFHLSNAAVAGRDIFIDQKFRFSLRIRRVLESFYLVAGKMDEKSAKEVRRYTKLFWLHNGIHHAYSTKKNILRMTPAEYDAACRLAKEAGQELPSERQLILLYEVMTDPKTHASCTNKSPGEGKDPLLESCNNLYYEVRMADLEGFEEKYPLNSRLFRESRGLREEVYRAGDGDKIPAGRYAKEITNVIGHLQAALEFAPEKTKIALEALIKYYRTGEPKDWLAYGRAWVSDDKSVVDTINGFIEVYMDARGMKGAWEAVVSFMAPARGKQMKLLADNAQWFEDRMPWKDEFKKKKVVGINARFITVVMETGDSGPFTPVGINLPNEAEIRQNVGSKSVNLANVKEAYAALSGGKSGGEFSWDEAEANRARKWGSIASDIHTNLHEVVGHASGQVRAEIKNPAGVLGTYYSTLEEARADLVGLYWIRHPKLKELGIVEHEDVALAEYEGYARNALVQLRRVDLGDKIEQDHMRNRQMIVHWMLANSDAIKVEKRDGKTYYRVTSAEKFQSAAGELLAEVMRVKATGDFKAGKKLVDTYGTRIERKLHEEVLERLKPMNLPSLTGFVQPELRLVEDAAGKVTDVTVHYPKDLADQMLRWSGRK